MPEKKDTDFIDLVNSDPRFDIEDLRLFLNLKMELFGQLWIFGMGIIVSLIAIDIAIPESPSGTVAKVGIAIVIVVLYVFLISRRADPEKQMRRILQESDYLDAKEILVKRKPNPAV